MFTKAKIYNLALGALLLQRQISNVDTDTSNEAKVLNTHWDVAFFSTLQDMDLDSLMTETTLELLDSTPDNTLWQYMYKYPSKCVYLRRIKSCVVTDNRTTRIKLAIQNVDGQKVIFTDEASAVAECIMNDVSLASLSASAAMAIAYKLAELSAPLATGKGAAALRKEIGGKYILAKTQAQAQDRGETFNFQEDEESSEFVEARTSRWV